MVLLVCISCILFKSHILCTCSDCHWTFFNYLNFNLWIIKKQVNQSLYCTCSNICRASHCFIDTIITYRSEIIQFTIPCLLFGICFFKNWLQKSVKGLKIVVKANRIGWKTDHGEERSTHAVEFHRGWPFQTGWAWNNWLKCILSSNLY